MPAYGAIDSINNPNLNYPGSSGYGILPGGAYDRITAATPRADYPGYDAATGKLISVATGRPWTGPLPAGWTNPYGGQPTNPSGVQVPFAPPGTMINPNDPAQRYKPVDIPKNPSVVSGEQDLMKSFKDAAASSLQDFSTYLKNFTSDLGTARATGAAALNIGPTVNALQTGQSRYTAALGSDQARLDSLLSGNAAAEQGIVQQARDILPQYDAAAKAVADQQMAEVEKQLSRYKMGTGTPTSVGSDEERILASGAAKVYAPLELDKIRQQQNILTNLALPVQTDITNRATAALTQFDPQAQAAIWSSGRATAQDVQNLKQSIAGMAYQQAVQFMTALGVPVQVQQSILSGQIGQLGQLNALESASRYQGLQDVLGAFPSQPQGYSAETGGIPNYPPRNPTTTNTVPGGSTANPPVTFTGSGIPSYPVGTGPSNIPPGTTPGVDASGNPVYNAPTPGVANFWNPGGPGYVNPTLYPTPIDAGYGDSISIPDYSGLV